MKYLYDVKDLHTGQIVLKEKPSREVADFLGMSSSTNISAYAVTGYAVQTRYKIIHVSEEESIERWKREWEYERHRVAKLYGWRIGTCALEYTMQRKNT